MERERPMMGGKGKVSEEDRSFDKAFWETATPEEKIQAIFDLRDLYHEVLHPEVGDKRLDRSVGGVRRRGD